MDDFPIVEYDDRYFAHCKHNKAELYEVQKHILSIIHDGSFNILKDLDSKIDKKEIDLILRDAYQKELIKRKRLGVIAISKYHKIPIYRYYTYNMIENDNQLEDLFDKVFRDKIQLSFSVIDKIAYYLLSKKEIPSLQLMKFLSLHSQIFQLEIQRLDKKN